MKLEKLTLTNFRGFDQIELELAPDLTVIAGVNGIGKSSLLTATATVASHLLPVISQSKAKTLELTTDDIHSGKPALTISALCSTAGGPFHAQVVRSVRDPAKVEEYQKRRDEARFAMRQMKKESREEMALVEEIRFLDELLRPDKDHFTYQCEGIASTYLARIRSHPAEPLVIHYSTERYFRGMPPTLGNVKPLSPSDAHTDSLAGKEVKLHDFANWVRYVQTDENVKFGKMLLELLNEAISKMLPGFSNLQLFQGFSTYFDGRRDEPFDLGEMVIGKKPFFSVTKGQETLKLSQLSDGEQGLLALVFDLTRRLAIANPKSKKPLTEGVAVVLIDEIELHLHPKWQRQVLRHLKEIFQSCQFIITTHSPQVIGQVPSDKLRLLHPDENGKLQIHRLTQAYGMDSSWILQNIMGCPVRDYKTEQKLAAIFDLIDAGKFPKARKEVKALEKEVGMFPELQEADSLLDRMKLLGAR